MSQELESSFNRLNDELEQLRKIIKGQSASVMSERLDLERIAENARADIDEKRKQFSQNLSRSIDDNKNALLSLGQTMMSGRGSTQALVTTFGSLAKTIKAVLGPLGMVATITGGLLLAVVSATVAVVKQNEAVLEGFDDLSDFGVTVSKTSTQYRDMLQNAFQSMEYAKAFNTELKRILPSLMLHQKSTGASAEMFSNILSSARDFRYEMQALGLSTEEQVKLFGSVVQNLALTQNLKEKDSKQISRSAHEWIRTSMEYANALGLSSQGMISMTEKLLKLPSYYAVSRQAQQEKRDLTVFHTGMSVIGELLGTEVANDIALYHKTNNAQTEFLQNVLGRTPELAEEFKNVQNMSREEMSEFIKKLGAAVIRNNASLEESLKVSDSVAKMVQAPGKSVGETVAAATRMQAHTLEALVKKAGDDPAVELREKKQKIEDILVATLTKFISLISGPINAALNTMADGILSFITALKDSELYKWFFDDEPKKQSRPMVPTRVSAAEQATRTSANKQRRPAPGQRGGAMSPPPLSNSEAQPKTTQTSPPPVAPNKGNVAQPKPAPPVSATDKQLDSSASVVETLPQPVTDAKPAAATPKSIIRVDTPSIDELKSPPKPTPENKKASTGAVFDGPAEGYKVELHNTEAVVPMETTDLMSATAPLKNGKSVPVNVKTTTAFNEKITSLNTQIKQVAEDYKLTTDNQVEKIRKMNTAIETQINDALSSFAKKLESSKPQIPTMHIDTTAIISVVSALSQTFEQLLEEIENQKDATEKLVAASKRA